jgi:hypothetical protein
MADMFQALENLNLFHHFLSLSFVVLVRESCANSLACDLTMSERIESQLDRGKRSAARLYELKRMIE